jgi:hypothetical protein
LKNKNIFWLFLPSILTFQLTLVGFDFLFFPSQSNFAKRPYSTIGNSFLYYLPLKDTLYYLGNEYIEVDLSKQLAFYVTRQNGIDTIKISSGNKFLKKAIETPAGLYAVQNKAPVQISRQFENTEMLNWIGFNGNIGFHALEKTGYYVHLGRRPSSHGCVRISNEDGIRLFKKVRIGIPVLVYYKEPVYVIRFATWKEFNPNEDVLLNTLDRSTSLLLAQRVARLKSGDFFRRGYKKIFLFKKLKVKFPYFAVEKPDTLPLWQKPCLWFFRHSTIENFSSKVVPLQFHADTCAFPYNRR